MSSSIGTREKWMYVHFWIKKIMTTNKIQNRMKNKNLEEYYILFSWLSKWGYEKLIFVLTIICFGVLVVLGTIWHQSTKFVRWAKKISAPRLRFVICAPSTFGSAPLSNYFTNFRYSLRMETNAPLFSKNHISINFHLMFKKTISDEPSRYPLFIHVGYIGWLFKAWALFWE